MRLSVRLLVLLAVATIVALVLLMRPSPNSHGTSVAATSSIPTMLLSRAEARPERNHRGREFLKRVFSRNRPSTPSQTEAVGLEIGSILESSEDDRAKAKRLLELALAHPDEESLEAVNHAVNLVTDADYEILRTTLTNARSPEIVMDPLLADVLSRGNTLKLPTLVAIARQPDHLRATEARDLLELHIGEDHGTNWTAWLEAARVHIAEHGE
jgi:hypothetical protein